jgi:hypothetical protein
MALLTKDALLGASDLVERDVDLPTIGGSVRVRSLPAASANDATSSALEMTTDRHGEQTAHVNTNKLEALQVLRGLIDPKLDTLEEAYAFQQSCGPAWHTLVEAITEISGINRETAADTAATFQAGGPAKTGPEQVNGASGGDVRPDLPVSAGA